MNWGLALAFAPVLLALVVAAATDARLRRIPNALVLTIAIAGWAAAAAGWIPTALHAALLGSLLGVAMLFPLFVIRAFGAGDVKLLGAVGAWVGPSMIVWVVLIAAILGGVLAIAWAIAHRAAGGLARDTAFAVGNLAMVGQIGVDTLGEINEHARRSRRRSIPYAVPLALATAAVLFVPGVHALAVRTF